MLLLPCPWNGSVFRARNTARIGKEPTGKVRSSYPRTEEMHDYDPTRITSLSTTTVVFLIVFLPAILLAFLLWVSYTFAPWV